MSTTKPVVADSVMVSVVSERQDASAASRDCTTAIWPNGAFSMRTVASARLSSGKVISMTPAPAPKVVSGCVGPSRSIRRRPMVASAAGVAAATTPSALVRMKRRPAAVAQGGSARASTSCGRASASAGCLSGCCRRSAAISATASSATTMSLRACRRWSSTCTTAPTQMVARNAMMSTGTARRSKGSAVNRRRYAGLAIDCARP